VCSNSMSALLLLGMDDWGTSHWVNMSALDRGRHRLLKIGSIADQILLPSSDSMGVEEDALKVAVHSQAGESSLAPDDGITR